MDNQASLRQILRQASLRIELKNKKVTTNSQLPPKNTDGKIEGYFRTYDYAEIYRYTSRRVEIKTGGERHIPCEKCSYFKRHFHGVTPDGFCGCHELACIRNLDYFSWCLCNATKIRAELVKKGLWTLSLNGFIGYDADRRALIFILDKTRYIDLPFTDGEFTCDRDKVLAVLMHYNVDRPNKDGGFSQTPKPYMPFLDNRFYGANGEAVIATAQGDVVLPFNLQ